MQEKYEQRRMSGDIFDDYVAFLSGDLCDGGQSIKGKNMEVSYTKEQQKQRQKQQNKNKVAYCMPQTVWTFNLWPKRLKIIGKNFYCAFRYLIWSGQPLETA